MEPGLIKDTTTFLATNPTKQQLLDFVSSYDQPEEYVRTDNISDRFSLFPIVDEEAYAFYKKQEASMWSSNEISFIQDKKDYEAAPEPYKRLLRTIVTFFLPGDGLVNNNLIHRFMKDCTCAEEVAFYTYQMANETTHAETYGLTAYTIFSQKEVEQMGRDVNSHESYFRLKTDFIDKWTQSNRPWSHRQLAMACTEGIFFVVLFLFVFWFRSKNIFKNVIFANELISTDETLHQDFGANRVVHYGGVSRETAIEIIGSAVEIEMEFISRVLPQPLEDLNITDIRSFVSLVADNLFVKIGQEPYYHAKNPYLWMNDVAMVKRNLLFECKSGTYTKMSHTEAADWETRSGQREEELEEVSPFDFNF